MINPFDKSCASFIQCSNGNAFKQACPAGLLFNPSAGVCDWPAAVNCNYCCKCAPGEGRGLPIDTCAVGMVRIRLCAASMHTNPAGRVCDQAGIHAGEPNAWPPQRPRTRSNPPALACMALPCTSIACYNPPFSNYNTHHPFPAMQPKPLRRLLTGARASPARLSTNARTRAPATPPTALASPHGSPTAPAARAECAEAGSALICAGCLGWSAQLRGPVRTPQAATHALVCARRCRPSQTGPPAAQASAGAAPAQVRAHTPAISPICACSSPPEHACSRGTQWPACDMKQHATWCHLPTQTTKMSHLHHLPTTTCFVQIFAGFGGPRSPALPPTSARTLARATQLPAPAAP